MNSGVFFIVQGIDIGAFADEKLDDETVAGNDGQMEWSVAFFISLIE